MASGRRLRWRFYKRDTGDKLYRRSLYTFWKRSAPPASMDIFNAPTRESCTVRRERTNTPLQALVTLNDPQFVESSRRLSQRAFQEEHGHFPQRSGVVRLDWAWRCVTRTVRRTRIGGAVDGHSRDGALLDGPFTAAVAPSLVSYQTMTGGAQ